ncbi:Protein-export membrane protein SecD [uncultured archaeon]|nr:Protein-export membrane protein SecD [uncultured archaeon]
MFRTSSSSASSTTVIEQWPAIGLLSAPFLSTDVSGGLPSYSYSITGSVSGATDRTTAATDEVKKITSILKGGSLPVQISLGSETSIPAPLGQQFLQLSIIGILAAIVAIALFVSVRYWHLKIIAPILLVSISELLILVSLLGSFTIDLAAMAGILAALGVGVDAQIVITDELLKKEGKNHEEKLNHAFNIITTNVIVAVVAMLPLLFSGMVEIIGFALSTIIGSLLGFMISRPVYALLVERIIE